jgi:RNA 2',3'-cyclic 3'-phosphodiesterase
MRCFAALLLDPATRQAVADEVEQLRPLSRAVAWVPAENLHLTLRFLGEQPETALAGLTEALAEAARAAAPFALTFRTVGAFPGLERPRVLWAGLQEGVREARAVQAGAETALEVRGFGREARPWHPHLTLGRVFDPRRWSRDAGPELRAALGRALVRPSPATRVEAIALVRSDLSREGARYTALAELPLGTGPA